MSPASAKCCTSRTAPGSSLPPMPSSSTPIRGDRRTASDFQLPGVDGKTYSLDDFKDARVLVIVFSCNHCPAVRGTEDRMIAFSEACAPNGVAMVAINANESVNHPTDSFDHMVSHARE